MSGAYRTTHWSLIIQYIASLWIILCMHNKCAWNRYSYVMLSDLSIYSQMVFCHTSSPSHYNHYIRHICGYTLRHNPPGKRCPHRICSCNVYCWINSRSQSRAVWNISAYNTVSHFDELVSCICGPWTPGLLLFPSESVCSMCSTRFSPRERRPHHK